MDNIDYEKAYKAVLQTATQWIKDGCTDKERICLECVFPELRESEDERIRRKMIEHFKSKTKETWCNMPVKDIIAYLEKQKEPKHAPDDLQKSFEAGQTSIVDNPEQYGLCKKSEWSEEDEKEYNYIMSYLDTAPKGKQNHAAKWLKKRRPCPSWKPSEEQMRALGDYIDGEEISSYDIEEIVSLYNNLRNL